MPIKEKIIFQDKEILYEIVNNLNFKVQRKNQYQSLFVFLLLDIIMQTPRRWDESSHRSKINIFEQLFKLTSLTNLSMLCCITTDSPGCIELIFKIDCKKNKVKIKEILEEINQFFYHYTTVCKREIIPLIVSKIQEDPESF